MKFQNCILINFVTDGRMDAWTDKPTANMPFQPFHHFNSLTYVNLRSVHMTYFTHGV